jgi:hypothetical protein
VSRIDALADKTGPCLTRRLGWFWFRLLLTDVPFSRLTASTLLRYLLYHARVFLSSPAALCSLPFSFSPDSYPNDARNGRFARQTSRARRPRRQRVLAQGQARCQAGGPESGQDEGCRAHASCGNSSCLADPRVVDYAKLARAGGRISETPLPHFHFHFHRGYGTARRRGRGQRAGGQEALSRRPASASSTQG